MDPGSRSNTVDLSDIETRLQFDFYPYTFFSRQKRLGNTREDPGRFRFKFLQNPLYGDPDRTHSLGNFKRQKKKKRQQK